MTDACILFCKHQLDIFRECLKSLAYDIQALKIPLHSWLSTVALEESRALNDSDLPSKGVGGRLLGHSEHDESYLNVTEMIRFLG